MIFAILLSVLVTLFGIFESNHFKTVQEPNAIQLVHLVTISDENNNGPFFKGIQSATITTEGHTILLPGGSQEVHVYNRKGEYTTTFGRKGRGPGEFLNPFSLISGPNDNIFVADFANAKISVFNNSSYELINEFPFSPGWDIQFLTEGEDIYVLSYSTRAVPGGHNAVKIFKIKKDLSGVDEVHDFNRNSSSIQHQFITVWYSKWDVSADGSLYVTGSASDDTIYQIDSKGELITSFGLPKNQIVVTKEEIENRIERARRVNDQMASILSDGPEKKPIFKNIALDQKGYVWTHRSSEFGSPEEFDVYTSEGEFKMTVTLPPTKNKYRLFDIYDDKVLFRVIDTEGRHSLKIYQIVYE